MNDLLKNRKITLRLNEVEYIEFRQRMEIAGYKSMSKFIRKKIFSSRISKRKSFIDDRNLIQALSLFTAEIKKIGVNYNQVVRNYNAQRATISSFKTEIMMKNLDKLTRQLLQEAIKIKEKAGINE